MKKTIINIMAWATIALIIPILGNQFVYGWNWRWHEFVFAWVFWVVMGTAILFVVRRVSRFRIVAGLAVFLAFAAVWVMLATG